MSYNTILLDKTDHIARLTLNRPERLSALNDEMFAELNHALDDVAGDAGLWVFIITGAGRAFCASADIKDESQGRRPTAGAQRPLRDLPVHTRHAPRPSPPSCTTWPYRPSPWSTVWPSVTASIGC